MARKGRNIYKRNDGRWEGRIILGYRENGKRKYHSIYGKSYTEVKGKMNKYVELNGNQRSNGKTIEYILYFWLREKEKEWKPSTYANYRRIIENHLKPYWAQKYPEDLGIESARKFIMTKKNDGLSYDYIKNMYGLLLQALKYYETSHEEVHYKIPSLSIIGKKENMPDVKKLPSLETINKIEKILHKENIPEQVGLLIAINTGIRIGELCGLQWKDIDLENGIIHINKTMQRINTYKNRINETEVCIMKPKSNSSIRDIPIPSHLIDFLIIKRGNLDDYVVPGKKVKYCEPRTLQYRFERFLQRNNIEEFHFHALRHCFASRCIELGFDAKSLCEIMGHSDIQITLRLYVYTSLKQKRTLMDRLNYGDV